MSARVTYRLFADVREAKKLQCISCIHGIDSHDELKYAVSRVRSQALKREWMYALCKCENAQIHGHFMCRNRILLGGVLVDLYKQLALDGQVYCRLNEDSEDI